MRALAETLADKNDDVDIILQVSNGCVSARVKANAMNQLLHTFGRLLSCPETADKAIYETSVSSGGLWAGVQVGLLQLPLLLCDLLGHKHAEVVALAAGCVEQVLPVTAGNIEFVIRVAGCRVR